MPFLFLIPATSFRRVRGKNNSFNSWNTDDVTRSSLWPVIFFFFFCLTCLKWRWHTCVFLLRHRHLTNCSVEVTQIGGNGLQSLSVFSLCQGNWRRLSEYALTDSMRILDRTHLFPCLCELSVARLMETHCKLMMEGWAVQISPPTVHMLKCPWAPNFSQ